MKKIKLLILFIFIFCSILSFINIYFYKNSINKIYIDNDEIIIELKDNKITYCSFDKKNWIKSKKNKCILNYSDNNKNIYLQNKYGFIIHYDNKNKLSSIKEFKVSNSKIYLPINGKEQVKYELISIVDKKNKIVFKSLDENIAKVDSDGIIHGVRDGKTKILVTLENYSFEIDVIVTNLIVNKPIDYNYKKDYIKCNEFSEEDNNLIDEILLSRINKVGLNTRAAVVEAARFMTLEFSKRIPYSAENGRLSLNGIDAEGRYYKSGMFLNESRFNSVKKSMYGPASWGCRIYSYPVERTIPNGLDCSGFVSWAFINAGFDVGDIGAGITDIKDFTDIGNKLNLKDSIKNNKLRVGDLLSGKFVDGGHIAIIIGIKDGYYYIAESLYIDNHTYYGVVARKYKFDDLNNYFSWHIDMNNFYIEDGILTDYWL